VVREDDGPLSRVVLASGVEGEPEAATGRFLFRVQVPGVEPPAPAAVLRVRPSTRMDHRTRSATLALTLLP
jgi:hypothetical protein